MTRPNTVFPAARLHSSLAGLALGVAALQAGATPPSKVVIVIEENHGFEQVIGSPEAPFMNALANQGALFTNIYGLTHPSQPNYIEFFAGSNLGITDNSVPLGLPLSAPNLGAGVRAKGNSYASFCQGLPAIGSNIEISGAYARKHNPTPNWQAAVPGLNQLPPTCNLRFLDFPSDFSQLPTVSIVVPDLDNDMHDGTIAQADAWLQTNLSAYISWANANNALLIITWDEDGFAQRNRIPTIFYGPMVRQGVSDACYTLHNILRTVEDWHAVGHAGAAAQVRPMLGALKTDPVVTTTAFCQGEAGYTGAADTYLEQAAPLANRSATTVLVADGSPLSQILIRFDNLFGAGAGQIPSGATIVSAKLRMLSTDSSANRMSLHRMLTPWTATSNWTSLGTGVSADGVEAASVATFSPLPNTIDTWVVFDVTSDLEAFASGAETNQGWAVLPSGTDGWRMSSCEAVLTDRPRLEVTYYLPECASFALEPDDEHACGSGSVSFVCAATGNPPPSLQWRHNGVPIPGQNSPTLNIAMVTEKDLGVYDCVATGACGDTISRSASLTACLADRDCSGEVDLADFFDFFNCFDQNLPCAELDGESGIDLGDFFAFFNGFDAGC